MYTRPRITAGPVWQVPVRKKRTHCRAATLVAANCRAASLVAVAAFGVGPLSACAAESGYRRDDSHTASMERSEPTLEETHIWVRGHWQRAGKGWTWEEGYWLPKRPGYKFVQGSWVERGGLLVWRPGHWERRPAEEGQAGADGSDPGAGIGSQPPGDHRVRPVRHSGTRMRRRAGGGGLASSELRRDVRRRLREARWSSRY